MLKNLISSNECIIFLDFDGVLNCQVFYEKNLDKRCRDLCTDRVEMLNILCKELDAKVVVSSSWRKSNSTGMLQDILNNHGATFEVIDKTKSSNHGIRGVEIYEWIKENVEYSDNGYKKYLIFDDDGDMLLWQRENFFMTDAYSGLTPNLLYRAKRYINGLR